MTEPAIIEITRTNDTDQALSWRATIRLPKKLGILDHGILGANGPGGPFVEGFGRSADDALVDAYLILGRAVVGHIECEPEERKVPS